MSTVIELKVLCTGLENLGEDVRQNQKKRGIDQNFIISFQRKLQG